MQKAQTETALDPNWIKLLHQASALQLEAKIHPALSADRLCLAIINKSRELKQQTPTSVIALKQRGQIYTSNQTIKALEYIKTQIKQQPLLNTAIETWARDIFTASQAPKKSTLTERGITLGPKVSAKTTHLNADGVSVPNELHTDFESRYRQYSHINASIRQAYLSIRHFKGTLAKIQSKIQNLNNETATECLSILEQLQAELRYGRRRAQDYKDMALALLKIKFNMERMDALATSLAISEGLQYANKRISVLDQQEEKFKIDKAAFREELLQMQAHVIKIQNIHEQIFAAHNKDPWHITQRVIQQAQAYVDMLLTTKSYPGLDTLRGRHTALLENYRVIDQIRLTRAAIRDNLPDKA